MTDTGLGGDVARTAKSTQAPRPYSA